MTDIRRLLTRVTVASGMAVCVAWGMAARAVASPEVSCNVVVTTDENCGGADARCRIVTISGTTTAEGDINIEVDWDDGAGSGENQNISGPEFSGGWIHSYQDNGLRHIRIEAEDTSGAKCQVEHSEFISG